MGVLVEPNYAFCKIHNDVHPNDIDFATECIVDIIYNDLSADLKRVLSNSREILCEHYETQSDKKTSQKMIWSNLNDDRLSTLCGLTVENLSKIRVG